jgi:hypothetical protein
MRCSTTSIIVLVELQQAWREDFADQYRTVLPKRNCERRAQSECA